MRSNGNNSERGTGNCDGSHATTTSVNGGYGRLRSGGNGNGREETKKDDGWFEPVTSEEEVSDCPGGICPVPWAVDTSGDENEITYDKKVWNDYVKKHEEIFVDNVNHPSHYNDGGLECIEAIEAQLTPEEYRGYLKGNVAKYVWREKHKGGIESLKKAQWYLTRLIAL
tara:strand:- start:2533 stop:3039 length:507 start_codon:yes stop_codon:yes gene_type:complete